MANDLAETLLEARDADRQARQAVWATIAKQHGMPGQCRATEALLAAMTKAERRQAHRRSLSVGRRFDTLINAMDGPGTAAAFKALRLAAGLSEADLEADWQLKPHTIRRWESGQRKRIRKWEFHALFGSLGKHETGQQKNSLHARLSCHLITLSARASTFGGIVRPICLAVLRLIARGSKKIPAGLIRWRNQSSPGG